MKAQYIKQFVDIRPYLSMNLDLQIYYAHDLRTIRLNPKNKTASIEIGKIENTTLYRRLFLLHL